MLGVLMTVSLSQIGLPTSVAPEEMAEAGRWVAAKFEGRQEKERRDAGLLVLANHAAVELNARSGKPLRIVDKQYTRGLYCHAVSKVVVRLPGPGKSFTAIVGVDSNDQTRPGRGSIVFSVTVGQEKRLQSALMREGMPGVPVQVDLGGADEFVLEVGDGGNGISCDQADWADARVMLANGRTVWLGDLPIAAGPQPYDTNPFFSFTYDGRKSGELLKTWALKRASRRLDHHRTEYTLTYTDPKTGLVVRCAGVAWKDYPTVEWTLHLKNEGTTDTPILESIQAIDTVFTRSVQGEFLLHRHLGDKCAVDSFAPIQTALAPKASEQFASVGGRPTNGQWPYYNLERPSEKAGVIIVIGWPGQWACRFVRDDGVQLHVVGGQELTHFKLHPGEEVRTPLVVLQFYRGDWLRAQNVWRRWMFEHNFPKDHGKPLSPKLGGASVWPYHFNCTQTGDIGFIDRFLAERMQLSYWWMDAGWYKHEGAGWPKVGTWEVDDKRFPGGLKAVTDHAHARGVEVIVWFEVERVAAGTWIAKNHPEWVHGGAGGGLLKMDEPEVVRWITDHVDEMISKEGIDLYRSDFNIDPLRYWRGNDAKDRQGITEIRYVEGYLAYWDELRRRHPGMLIDSCASGGRRNDLETMRRAVPLLRTDFERSPEGNQCCTYGFDLWLPYHDSVNWENVTYNFRSNIAPFLQLNWDVRQKDFDHDRGRKSLSEWRSVVDYYFGDFWPLGTYSTSDGVWLAWQLDRPDLNAGLVQAFRRRDCPYVSARYKLRSLQPDARYIVSNLDCDQPTTLTGRELMDHGLLVTIPDQPGAVLVTYKKE